MLYCLFASDHVLNREISYVYHLAWSRASPACYDGMVPLAAVRTLLVLAILSADAD